MPNFILFQAIAAGSLLYVAAFEVLPRERFKYQHSNDHKSAGLLQLIFVSLGFACITLLNIFVGKSVKIDFKKGVSSLT